MRWLVPWFAGFPPVGPLRAPLGYVERRDPADNPSHLDRRPSIALRGELPRAGFPPGRCARPRRRRDDRGSLGSRGDEVPNARQIREAGRSALGWIFAFARRL